MNSGLVKARGGEGEGERGNGEGRESTTRPKLESTWILRSYFFAQFRTSFCSFGRELPEPFESFTRRTRTIDSALVSARLASAPSRDFSLNCFCSRKARLGRRTDGRTDGRLKLLREGSLAWPYSQLLLWSAVNIYTSVLTSQRQRLVFMSPRCHRHIHTHTHTLTRTNPLAHSLRVCENKGINSIDAKGPAGVLWTGFFSLSRELTS